MALRCRFPCRLLVCLTLTILPALSCRLAPFLSVDGSKDGQGTAWVMPHPPVVAGCRGSWTFGFRVGRHGIAPGGAVALQIPPFWWWTPPQTADPNRPGYCTVKWSGECSLAVAASPSRMLVVARVLRGVLAEGDTLWFTYGDTSSPRGAARAEPYAERFQEFVFKTDADGDGTFREIALHPGLEVRAQAASVLWVNAPSVVEPGQRFSFTVAALDSLGNCDVTYSETLSIQCDVPCQLPATVVMGPADSGAVRIWATLLEPGVATLSVADRHGRRGVSNPVWCQESGPFQKVWWGDIHGHSGLSDGTGDPYDYYRYARDVAGLDVASLTDHDAWGIRPLSESTWGRLVGEAKRFHEPGRFVTLVGYEWTSWRWGHRTVYFPGDSGQVFPAHRRRFDSPPELRRALRRWGAITVPHHPGGGPVPTRWERRGGDSLVEVFSVHGSSEYYGCPRMIHSPVPGRFVQDALAMGLRLGFLASGDGHVGHPGRWCPESPQGLVAFLADTLTREAVWQALRERRVYATTGQRILLQFRAQGWPMGSVVTLAPGSPLTLDAAVVGTARPLRLEVVKNGTVWRAMASQTLSYATSLADSSWSPGDYYYLRVLQEDGHQAWSSPIWVQAEE